MSGLSAGDCDREIVLETAQKSQDSMTNQEVLAWDVIAPQTLWAQWIPAGTREAWQAAQARPGSYIDGVFRIYEMDTRPAPDTSRILFQGRVFDVTGVTELGRGEGLDVMVVAKAESV